MDSCVATRRLSCPSRNLRRRIKPAYVDPFAQISSSKLARSFQVARRVRTRCASVCGLSGSSVYKTLIKVQWTPNARSMAEVYDLLADRLSRMLSSGNGVNGIHATHEDDAPAVCNMQYLIGVAGAPGSGKSTMTAQVCARVNSLAGKEVAVVVPMDGYHLTRAQLDQMSDPQFAHSRRGAYWTFDEVGFVDMVQKLRATGTAVVPSFDHAVGDPVPGDIQVSTDTPIVIIEGNYLLLDYHPWGNLKELFDESWFLYCDIDEAMRRVENRHVETGVTRENAAAKIHNNDRINGNLVNSTAGRADVLIKSITLAPEEALP